MRRTLGACQKYLRSVCLISAILAPPDWAHATSISVLYAFSGGSDGSLPQAVLIGDKAGNLYSTTAGGGTFEGGTVFKIAPGGAESVLHAFQYGSDGGVPRAGLLADKVGNLYGTTQYGGGTGCNGSGCGTVFKVAPDGTEAVLYAFTGGSDGGSLLGGLIADKAGNFYGTTFQGGNTGCGGEGCGTVFKLAPNGTETVLYAFKGGNDGSNSEAALIEDKAGNLYGTTVAGGGTGCAGGRGCGTVFKLASDGTETVLYAFSGGSDGGYPSAALIADASGNFYSTAPIGGTHGRGEVFKLSPEGAETVIHSFVGKSDGSEPTGGLIEDASGNLYGTTNYGGSHNRGTVFEIAPNGTETVLKSFGNKVGTVPLAGLLMARGGAFYGTTDMGGGSGCGGYGCGVVFKLNP